MYTVQLGAILDKTLPVDTNASPSPLKYLSCDCHEVRGCPCDDVPGSRGAWSHGASENGVVNGNDPLSASVGAWEGNGTADEGANPTGYAPSRGPSKGGGGEGED